METGAFKRVVKIVDLVYTLEMVTLKKFNEVET